ncbi:MAG: DNA polymerase III subunit delta' [Paracidovorax wautersii]|uniref:DNA polymerase III subunit delta n=1 Tax=Paracidovorax wautersii TaxID=1177982 RepID=A0A7V8FN83_9BURK|nr:MAG: DNA polymerase III subunit delta' [Paracidovorax wautersii]
MSARTSAEWAPWLQQQLEHLLRQPGHAWLLQGPSGLGQQALGLEVATAWLCEQATPQGACGHCASCKLVAAHTHPDLCVLMPETAMVALGWPLDEVSQKKIDDKERKASREIRVEAMRDAIEFTQRTSSRGRGKVLLVYPAERMNAVTANALLKTLEEPPGDVRFLLASEAAHQLLPTIRSRCLSHTLRWPATDEALPWLQACGVSAGDAAVLLQAAGGRPADALAWARGEVDARQWQQLPRALAKGDVQALAGRTPAEMLDVLTKLCHDLMSTAQGAAPRFFGPADLPRPPALAALNDWAAQLKQLARHAEHPFNAGLLQETLVAQAAALLQGSGHPR